MKLEQLDQIIEILNTGSFSQAARNLYISQPNLSHSVKQLENEFGFIIFTRTSEGVIPTPQGKELIEHFKIIRREYSILEEYCQNPVKPPQLSLQIATLNLNRTTPAFAAIVKKYMGSPIKFSFMHYTSLALLIKQVITCQVDFALIGTLSPYIKGVMAQLQNKHIEYHAFSTAPISVIVGPQNPLYYREEAFIKLDELCSATLISYGNEEEDPSYSLPHVTGLSNRVYGKIHVNSSQLFYKMIQTAPVVGLFACSPESFNRHKLWEDIRILRLKDCDIMAEFGWIKLRRVPLTDIASELIETVKLLF